MRKGIMEKWQREKNENKNEKIERMLKEKS